jgi:ABC-type Na+ efflux pump permease subunit
MIPSLFDPQMRVLFRKEWRQLVASKTAVATGAFLPALLLGVVPFVMSQAASAPLRPGRPLPEAMNIGFLGEVGGNPHHIAGAILPLLVAIVGMIVPTMMATHLLITERERRTLELLVALPVRIEQVLMAKLLATLVASSVVTAPLVLFDMISMPWRGAASVEQVIALPILLAAALVLSTSIALLMSLLSPDFRTANNVAGALLAPTMIGTLLFGLLLPGGPARAMGIALAYFITAFFLLRHALRTVTFERLLS